MTNKNLNIPKRNTKYWYSTDAYCCVICGREKKYKSRVYNINERGSKWIDDMCWEHRF